MLFTHWILLLSPVTFTTGYCFCFGSTSSFFLELFLHSSPVAYWAPNNLGVHLSVSYLFAFSYCSWGSQSKNTEVVFQVEIDIVVSIKSLVKMIICTYTGWDSVKSSLGQLLELWTEWNFRRFHGTVRYRNPTGQNGENLLKHRGHSKGLPKSSCCRIKHQELDKVTLIPPQQRLEKPLKKKFTDLPQINYLSE